MVRPRLHYAWIVFGASFVTLLGAAGFRSAPGVLVDPLRDEFGWDRATVGIAVSINVLLFGLIGPFAAAPFPGGSGASRGRIPDQKARNRLRPGARGGGGGRGGATRRAPRVGR